MLVAISDLHITDERTAINVPQGALIKCLPSRASSDEVPRKAEERGRCGASSSDDNAARCRGWRRAAGNWT